MPIFKDYPQLELIQKISKSKNVSIFLVGGFLRDYLLKKQKLDLDFAVEKDAIGFAKAFSKKIRGAFVLLDEERGCARIAKKTVNGIYTFDFADFRAKTFKGDLSHRDFTINTLSLNVALINKDTEINDILKDNKNGLKDLKAKTIKMVSDKAFKEDPLRMMRAFSIKAELGFKIDKQTISQVRKDKELIRDVSSERIREELFKILNSDNAGATFKAMDKVGLLDRVIPQVRVMYNCKQGTYHHLDVWPHSLETVFQTDKIIKEFKHDEDLLGYLYEPVAGTHTRLSILKLAALLHDLGKPETRRREENRLTFHGHERVGKDITKHIAILLKLSTKERHMLCDLVFWHLRPGYLSNFKQPSEKMIYRFFRDTKGEAVSTLLLSLADQRSTCGPLTTKKDQEHHEKICLSLIKKYFDKKKEKPFVRLLNGDDIIKKLKMKPSPLIGKLLKDIEEAQNLGKIKTKKEALELARMIVKK